MMMDNLEILPLCGKRDRDNLNDIDKIHKFDPEQDINLVIHFRDHHYLVHQWVLRFHSRYFETILSSLKADHSCEYCKYLLPNSSNKCITFSEEQLTFLDGYDLTSSDQFFLLFLVTLYYPNTYWCLPYLPQNKGITLEVANKLKEELDYTINWRNFSISLDVYNSGKSAIEISSPTPFDSNNFIKSNLIHHNENDRHVYAVILPIITLFNFFECSKHLQRSEDCLKYWVQVHPIDVIGLLFSMRVCYKYTYLFEFKKEIIKYTQNKLKLPQKESDLWRVMKYYHNFMLRRTKEEREWIIKEFNI